MLTGTQIRMKVVRDKIVPHYLHPEEPEWQSAAAQLINLFTESNLRTRGELEEDLQNFTAPGPQQLVWQGLAKLLDDRCEYEVTSDFPPDQIREAAFRIAAKLRIPDEKNPLQENLFQPKLRSVVLKTVAEELNLSEEQVDVGLFADLKDEQRVIKFEPCSVDYLIKRYNVALAQGLLIRSTRLEAIVWGESQARFRQLFRMAKFHKLICQIVQQKNDSYHLVFDGPLSLFSSTQKYGLQLALFLPALMHCKNFELLAVVRWGAQRKEKKFTLTTKDGIQSHTPDFGQYQPPELKAFAESFQSKAEDWTINTEPAPINLGDEVWVPDFRVQNRLTDKEIDLEVLGYWRKSSLSRQLELLRKHRPRQFLLLVGDHFKADEEEELATAKEIVRYKRTPSVAEVVKAANAL